MRSSPRVLVPVLTALGLVPFTGCAFDDRKPSGVKIFCTTAKDCDANQACNPITARCVDANSAPPSITFEMPTNATTGATVQARVVADVALESATLVFFGADPGFGTPVVDGATATFTLAVDAVTPPDGFYALGSIAVLSAAGVPRVVPRDDALHIDRADPRIDVTAAPVNVSLPVSEVDGSRTVAVHFSSSEPLFDVKVGVGGDVVSSGCTLPAEPLTVADCTLTVSSGPPGIFQADVVVSGQDGAGNSASASAPLETDFAPPKLLNSAVSIERPDGALETAASSGSTLAATIVVDEPLAAAPAITLVAANPVVVDVVGEAATPHQESDGTLNPRVWDVRVVLGEVRGDTTVTVTAAMTDRVGHTASAAAIDALAVRAAHTSACAAASTESGPGDPCIDADGDGHVARVSGCVGGDDEDDTDPRVFVGMPEIPGDGVGNGGGADTPLDDAAGVYLSAASSFGSDDPSICGTADFPCHTFNAALNVPNPSGRFLLEGGGLFNDGAPACAFTLIGGYTFSGGAWSRNAVITTPSVVHDDSIGIMQCTAPLYAGVTFATAVALPASATRAVLVDVDLAGISAPAEIDRPITIIGGSVDQPLNLGVEALLDHVAVHAPVRVALDARINNSALDGSITVLTTGTLDVVGSALRNTVDCATCGPVRLWQSTFAGNSVPQVSLVSADTVDIRNCIFAPPSAGTFVAAFGRSSATFVNNEATTDQGNVQLQGLAPVSMPALVNVDADHLVAFGDTIGFVALAPDGELEAGSTTMPAIALPAGMPAAAVDAFGACRVRPDGSIIVGMDATAP